MQDNELNHTTPNAELVAKRRAEIEAAIHTPEGDEALKRVVTAVKSIYRTHNDGRWLSPDYWVRLGAAIEGLDQFLQSCGGITWVHFAGAYASQIMFSPPLSHDHIAFSLPDFVSFYESRSLNTPTS